MSFGIAAKSLSICVLELQSAPSYSIDKHTAIGRSQLGSHHCKSAEFLGTS